MSQRDNVASEVDELRSSEPEARTAALSRIADRGRATPEEIDAIVDCLGAPEKIVQRRAAEACARLHRAGEKIVPNLMPGLVSDKPRQRWGTAYALCSIGPPSPEARLVVIESLGSVDGDVRWAAAEILQRNPSDDLVRELCMLLSTGNPAQRKMASYTLKGLDCRTQQVQAALTAALLDSDEGARIAAATALIHLADDRAAAVEAALLLLEDPVPGVRRASAALLGTSGVAEGKVVEALRRAAVDDDVSLSRAAAGSLRKLLGEGG